MPHSDALIASENDPTGFRGLVGYRLVEWREGEAVVELDLSDDHRNRAGVLHGGAIASMLDTACGYAATWSGDPERPRFCVTLSLTVSFTGQVAKGRIRARGIVKGGGRKIVFCTAELRDEAGNLVAMGEGSFRYRSGSERGIAGAEA